MHFHCLQHVPFETPGIIETWISQKRHSISFTPLYNNSLLPLLNDIDALIIMGGPMSVHDETIFPWLKKEKEFIASAIKQGKKIAGICLGAQLIADVLGAKVYNNPEKEIGFMPIHITAAARNLLAHLPNQETVFHWHGETFDLPDGAIRLAYTPVCTNQAYLIGNDILGLQFHLEVTPGIIKDMIEHEGHELVDAPFIHSKEKIMQDLHHLDSNKKLLFQLFNAFFR
jgi:GMP synthase-like glutamine amidotransferase